MHPENLMKTAVEAWGQADHRPITEILDEQVVWKSAATFRDGRFKFGDVYRGRNAVIEHLAVLSTAYFFTRCITREIVSNNDVAWGLFDVTGKYAPQGRSGTDRPLHFECAMRWRFRNGKLVEAQIFFDTVALLAQQGELPSLVA